MQLSDELKHQKETFVTGHSGSQVSDIVLVLLVCVLNYSIWRSYCLAFKVPDSTTAILVDAAILVLPFLMALLFYDAIQQMITAQFLTVILIQLVGKFLSGRKSSRKGGNNASKKISNHYISLEKPAERNHLSFVVTFRGFLQWLTILCILAVDFPLFPRMFAKVETFGTSIMDLGVGAAIFSSGIVAGPRIHKDSLGGLWKSIKLVIPLFLLGLGRLLATKSVNYQEHVTEYGVHWNFFFTLGSIPILLSLSHIIFPFMSSTNMGFLVGISYQIILTLYGGEHYILTAPRTTLFSMNREGLCSLVGYFVIFLFASDVGRSLAATATKNRSNKNSGVPWMNQLKCIVLPMLWSGFGYIMLVHYFDISVSRRMANLSYVFWISWMALGFLGFLLLVEIFIQVIPRQSPLLFRSVNYNMLFLFLLANLGTGFVNLTMNTITASTTQTILVLTVYMSLIVLIAYSLYKHDVKIKI